MKNLPTGNNKILTFSQQNILQTQLTERDMKENGTKRLNKIDAKIGLRIGESKNWEGIEAGFYLNSMVFFDHRGHDGKIEEEMYNFFFISKNTPHM